MNEKEKKRLTDTYTNMKVADEALLKAVELLAKFETDVPSLNVNALKMMAKTTNTISKSVAFIRSFIRVSTLQQVVKVKNE